jgi:protein-disulfide isomerase
LLGQFPEDLNYVVKHFPLPNHNFAYKSAMAAIAAGKQGKFWEFHSKLLENYDQINEEKIVELAGVVGLNIEQFNIDRESEEGRKVIQEDIENGSKIGVRGTPSVFLNGKRINNKELQNISEMIRHELNKEAVPVSTK